MFTEPASKVSVPFVVVRRMRSSVPDNATSPPPQAEMPSLVLPIEWLDTHTLLPKLIKLIVPDWVRVAEPASTMKPAVLVTPIPLNEADK